MKLLDNTDFGPYACGFILGTVESTFAQPFWTILQTQLRGESPPLSLGALYKGYLADVMSIAPAMAMQIGVNSSLQRVITPQTDDSIMPYCIASISGVSSAAVSCPTEMIKTQQQRHNMRLLRVLNSIFSHSGATAFFRGIAPVAARESVTAPCLLVLHPSLVKSISTIDWINALPGQMPLYVSYALATGLSATAAALLTQPIERIRSVQQYTLRNTSIFEATKEIIASRKTSEKMVMQVFYRGLLARLPLLCVSLAVMGFQQFVLEPDNNTLTY